jgi:hypothetical protein
VKIAIDCFYSEDQLDLVHTELAEVKAQCNDNNHSSSLYAAMRLVDEVRTRMKALGGFKGTALPA